MERETRKRKAARTVKDGEEHQIDGVLVTVKKRHRHGNEYRVTVRPAAVPVDNAQAKE